MKKKTSIIISIIVAVVVAVLIGVQIYFNGKTEELKKIEENLNKLSIATKSGENIELEYINFENGEFYLKVPKNFTQMSEEMLNVKYPNGNPPTYAYTNKETTINLAISISDANMKNEAIKPYLETMKTQMDSQAEVLETKVSNNDGHEIGQIKMITKAEDTEIYNHMMIFSCNDKFRVVSFNCTKELQEEWQDVGAFMIESLMFEVK